MTLALQIERGKKIVNPKKVAPLVILLLLGSINNGLASILKIRFIGLEYVFFAASGLLSLSAIYSLIRKDKRISEASYYAALWILSTAILASLTYISAALNFSLYDEELATIDNLLGFNWLSYYEFFKRHEAINSILAVSYHSLLPQIIFSLIFLPNILEHDRNNEFFWSALISLLITVVVSGILPAAGTFYHFKIGLDQAVHLQDFFNLRNANITEVLLAEMKGIVTFPSFHTTAALLLIYVYRGTRLFPFSLILNTLMLLSTPVFGGHYLTDMLGGGIVMAFSIYSVNRIRSYLGLIGTPFEKDRKISA